MHRHRGMYPVTLEGFGIRDCQRVQTVAGSALSFDLYYEDELLTTYCETTSFKHCDNLKGTLLSPLKPEYVTQIHEICSELLTMVHEVHDIPEPLRLETIYHKNIKKPEKLVYILFSILWELNELFDCGRDMLCYNGYVLNSKHDSLFACTKYALGDTIITVPKCATFAHVQIQRPIYAWYLLDVPVKARKLYVTLPIMYNWIIAAYRINVIQCRTVNVNA